MAKIILGFTGPMASGKEVSKQYLIDKYGAVGFRFSTIIREILARLRLEPSRYNISILSTRLRQTFGEDLFARTMAKDVAACEAEMIIVDGVRRLADIDHLKQLPGFHLIAIDADPKIRHARVVSRAENVGDDQKSLEEFLRESRELETEASIPGVMAEASYVIDNSTDLAALQAQLDDLVAKIKS